MHLHAYELGLTDFYGALVLLFSGRIIFCGIFIDSLIDFL